MSANRSAATIEDMSSTKLDSVTPPPALSPRTYWVATGLFCAVFVFSGVWSIVDPDGARETLSRLGYPEFFVYPQAIAKLLGVAAILYGRWRTLALFAFAGFLYDLLLALAAHIAIDDPQAFLAIAGLVVWAAAFWVDRRRYGTMVAR